MKTVFRVKILRGQGWYKRSEGKIFTVVEWGNSFVLAVDYEHGYKDIWRHIEREDVEIIRRGNERSK